MINYCKRRVPFVSSSMMKELAHLEGRNLGYFQACVFLLKKNTKMRLNTIKMDEEM